MESVMSDQLFKYAGYSVTESGQTKARFGNDMVSRIKKLTAKGNTDTFFVELPQAMTKQEASQHLLDTNEELASDFDVRDALQKVVFRNVPKTTRTVKTSTPSVESTVVVNEGAFSNQ
tara:strand:+ start:949 stop:1302 length:354 start_codon:yes stop_codon:yes gene_type:complete